MTPDQANDVAAQLVEALIRDGWDNVVVASAADGLARLAAVEAEACVHGEWVKVNLTITPS